MVLQKQQHIQHNVAAEHGTNKCCQIHTQRQRRCYCAVDINQLGMRYSALSRRKKVIQAHSPSCSNGRHRVMQYAALSCAIPAVSTRSTASVRILLLECLDTNALVPCVNARHLQLWCRDTPLCVYVMCLRRMQVCAVFSNL